MLVYVDSNVLIDYLKNRSGPEPYYKYAGWIVKLTVACKLYLAISDHAEKEVLKYVEREVWASFLEKLRQKVRRITVTDEDREEAMSIGSNNLPDALHAVLAARVGAEILFTRNLADFVDFALYLKNKGVKLRHPRAIYGLL
ncbi:MAG: PIN domain-containing protein [Candidatus Diapherotrites archaeon]|nr:PIN domain-containing protein [Candidatus Diapherotrites archaeon]